MAKSLGSQFYQKNTMRSQIFQEIALVFGCLLSVRYLLCFQKVGLLSKTRKLAVTGKERGTTVTLQKPKAVCSEIPGILVPE